MSWKRATRDKPCPICGKERFCSVAADGSVACCMYVESDWPCKGDMGGWIHKLEPGLAKRIANVFRRKEKPKPYLPPAYWDSMNAQFLEGACGICGSSVLARKLGVTERAMQELLVGWDMKHAAWTFPMWDGQGRMIGIRLRNMNGYKWAIEGSRNGLFWPVGLIRTRPGRLMICEGPTDCAALFCLGFNAIGRPSATAGSTHISEWLRGSPMRDVIIVADNDPDHQIGLRGATALADVIHPLCASVSVLQPPAQFKDVRQWYNAGATRQDILKVIEGKSHD